MDEVVKKRGRPPKVDPKQTKTPNPSESVEKTDQTVKKRGRPPKVISQPKVVTQQTEPSNSSNSTDKTEESTRKRGRPPKVTPQVEETEISDPSDSVEKTDEIARKRGRPPKMINPKTSTSVNSQTSDLSIEPALTKIINFYSTLGDENAESLLMTLLNEKLTESGMNLQVVPKLSQPIGTDSQSKKNFIFV